MSLHLPALISMPPLGADTALFALVVIVLLTVSIGGAALVAWRGLSARAGAIRIRHARMDERAADVPAALGRVRAQLAGANGDVERMLGSLRAFDRRLDGERATLAAQRARLDDMARADERALAGTIERIRGTLSVLRSARELRRTILG